MKWNRQWKSLSRDQRRAWQQWAKNNPVLLDHGVLRRVSGEKAFTIILSNRAIAGEAANPTVVPAAATWLTGALSVRDAGPSTTGAGFMGFRAEQEIVTATQWFVWATRPLTATKTHPQRWLVRRISRKCLIWHLAAQPLSDFPRRNYPRGRIGTGS